VLFGARLATTTARSGDDANLGNNATPLGARSVTTPLNASDVTQASSTQQVSHMPRLCHCVLLFPLAAVQQQRRGNSSAAAASPRPQ
jgi:hypothetical protein